MSGQSNTAFCKFGKHYVQRSTTVSVRIGDLAFLTCPDHREVAEALAEASKPAEAVSQ